MNSNLAHNILNVAFLIIGVLIATDWTTFGFEQAMAAQIAGGLMVAQNLIKLGINITRDGIGGLVKPQPPVDPTS